jgi:hypothetical protein
MKQTEDFVQNTKPEMVDVISNVANMKVVIKGRISITQMKQVEDFVKNIKNMIWLMLNTKGVFMNGVIHL